MPSWVAESFLYLSVTVGPLAFGAVEPWAAALVAVCVSGMMAASSSVGLPAPNRPLILALVAIAGFGVIQALNPRMIDEPSSFLPFSASSYSTWEAVRLWLLYAAVLWGVPRVLRDEAAVRRFLAVMLTLGCVISLLGIMQLSHDPRLLYGLRSVAYGYEPFGPYFNRDHAASLLAMCFCCGAGLFEDAQERRPGGVAGSFDRAAISVMILVGMALVFLGALLTLSRGGVAALLTCALVLLLTRERGRWAGAGLAVAALAVWASPLATRMTKPFLEAALSLRGMTYASVIALWADHPVFGTGLGAFQQAFYPYQSAETAGLLFEHAHNDLLESLAGQGLVGMVFFAAGTAAFLGQGRWRRRAPGFRRGLLAAVAAFLIHGLVDFNLRIPGNAAVFFALIGALGVFREREDGQAFGRWIPIAASLALTGIFLRPGIASWRHLHGDSAGALRWHDHPRYHHALSLRDSGVPAARHSLAAVHADPLDPRYRARLESLSRSR